MFGGWATATFKRAKLLRPFLIMILFYIQFFSKSPDVAGASGEE